MTMESVKNTVCSAFLTYSTPKLIQVPNTKIAIVNRILQLIIFAYIIGYIVVWKKGYQEFQEPHGTSIIKVKGIAQATASRPVGYHGNDRVIDTLPTNVSQYIWDVAEYQIPPIENNAFFITTRQTVTYGQTQTTCATALDDKYFCGGETNKTCPSNVPTSNTFGILTGQCVDSREDPTVQVCEMRGWCPEELSNSIDYAVNEEELDNFTVYLKTIVTFTAFKKTLRNIRANTNFSCRYDGTSANADCPIMPIGYMLSKLQTNRTSLLSEGGLIEIRQSWFCNFDRSPNSCTPTYDFNLLQSGEEKPSPGINYRFAHKYRENGTDYRILQKMYGLRFVVTITGQGGQFNIVNLFVAIGSGISFMVIAAIVSDALLMYAHKYRTRYRQGKISVLDMDDHRDMKLLIAPAGSDA